MTTVLAIHALRGLGGFAEAMASQNLQESAEKFRWHLLSVHVSGAMYPHLTGRSRVYARAAVALHRAQGATLAGRCLQAAQALKARGES